VHLSSGTQRDYGQEQVPRMVCIPSTPLMPTKLPNTEQSNSLSVCYGSDAFSFVLIWFKPAFTTYKEVVAEANCLVSNLFQTSSTGFFLILR
jgi:hypothetical protein